MSASASSASTPLYQGTSSIIEQFPGKYGGQQSDYLSRANEVIQTVTKKIRESLSSKDSSIKDSSIKDSSIQDLFFTCFDILRKARGDIARQHQTSNYERFGQLRTERDSLRSYTVVADKDMIYANRIKKILSTYLANLLDGKVVKKGDSISQVHAYTFEIPNHKQCTLLVDKMKGDKKASLQQQNKELSANFQKMKTSEVETYQQMSEYFEVYNYNQLIRHRTGSDLFNLPAESKVKMLAATIHLRIGQDLIPIAKLMVLYDARASKVDAVEATANHPTLTPQITHMDPEYITSCMQDIAALFEKIVTREKPDVASLKKDLAEFRYKFSYCMPCARGSAAIAEWFESAMAAVHNYKVTLVKKETLIDMEAFSTPYLPNFVKKYDELVQCEFDISET